MRFQGRVSYLVVVQPLQESGSGIIARIVYEKLWHRLVDWHASAFKL